MQEMVNRRYRTTPANYQGFSPAIASSMNRSKPWDSKKRQDPTGIAWAAATVILGPLAVPVYIAKRPLQEDEVREGGLAWNILKNFAIFWTLTMFVAGVAALIGASNFAGQAVTDAEKVGVGIGVVVGMGMMFLVWLVPMIAATLLGLFLKNSSIVEKGPTGPLAEIT